MPVGHSLSRTLCPSCLEKNGEQWVEVKAFLGSCSREERIAVLFIHGAKN